MRSWRVERHAGDPAVLHAASAEVAGQAPAARLVRELVPDRTAVVLGSAQRSDSVDRARLAARGWSLARRRSGGSAVLVGPGECRWVDLVVPAGDALWDADVGRAARWVGECWTDALRAAGFEAEVHEGPMARTRWSPLVCFAGLAAGEVTVGGAKVVGVSQRRTRAATLLQCALLERWQPADLLDVLALDDADRSAAVTDLAGVAAGVGARAGDVVGGFLSNLP